MTGVRVFFIVAAVLLISDVAPEHSVASFDGFLQQANGKNSEAMRVLKRTPQAGPIKKLLRKANKLLRKVEGTNGPELWIPFLSGALDKNLEALDLAKTPCSQQKENDCITARGDIVESTLNIVQAIETICGSEETKMQIDRILTENIHPSTSSLESDVLKIGSELAKLSRQC
ncbi:hypothetical protein Q1695_004334 [Nippostrongylus brasiliensis]|nr:hypothetical protein Q1695_004334 [Nippostrongylus brasiliensis]